ncbi:MULTISPECIES: glycosyltransferase family 4 protein [unclassified Photobacterium]|uniref:glycosyltransferase family 4 protein n=1 Tax=unclassified Photobacterium TaxID=2628852 RepID=UPI001EDEBA67|nr:MULTISPECIES: glycosyltransferase family 4 protein [unclassified Photobacterium]MCG3864038.1 glycosyltransferase family 4 protein [Photobacterium sp. Ph6]MCG3875568.1 glycosyltransferase family 4 protein [Photobacterium sp. Ph5]
MKNIVLICDIDVKKGSSFFDFLIQLPEPNRHFILLARSISEDAYSTLKSKDYTYSSFANFIQLFVLLLRYRPHLIHFHFYGIGHIYTFIARMFCSKIVLTMHNSPPRHVEITGWRRWKQSVLGIPLVRLCAISPFILQWLQTFVPQNKIILINNGINLSRFNFEKMPAITNKLRCFYVGSLTHEKGIHYLLALFSHPDVAAIAQLDIYGDGKLEQQVKHAAEGEKAINYHGRSTQIERELRHAHVVLMPSCWQEAFGYVAVEAMAVGRPVIAESIGGLAEIFIDKKQGWYVYFEQTDQVQKLLKLLYNKNNLLDEISVAARERVEREYDLTRQILQTHAMYTSLLER